MAIKLPDPGNGIPEQKTGNDEWTNMKIVRDNFADKSNAASRLVGTSNGQIPLAEDTLKASLSYIPETSTSPLTGVFNTGEVFSVASSVEGYPFKSSQAALAQSFRVIGTSGTLRAQTLINASGELAIRGGYSSGAENWRVYYHTGNTTKDGNGFLKAASPVVDLYDNKIDLNSDAEKQGVEFIKNGTGDYTLKTKTGLRSDNTWRIEIPNDDNRNPLFAVDIDAQDDGTINIRCYKRIFNMQTFLFEPDLKEPMDITEGRFISVRLNDNPEQEQLDEPTI